MNRVEKMSKALVASENLYVRFMMDIGKMSPYVCPIRKTPHYDFSYGIMEKVLCGEKVSCPENSKYESYIRWEEHCLGGSMGHTPKRYYRNIAAWSKNFTIEEHLPEVMALNETLFFIYDGVHRVAFLCVLIDLQYIPDQIPVQIIAPNQKVVPVLGIKEISACINLHDPI